MVGHEAVGMADPIIAFVGMLESIQEVQTVLLILENGLSFVPAGGDAVDSSWIFYAEGTRHNGETLSQNKAIVKIQDLTVRSNN
jgi:hypothetical protein